MCSVYIKFNHFLVKKRFWYTLVCTWNYQKEVPSNGQFSCGTIFFIFVATLAVFVLCWNVIALSNKMDQNKVNHVFVAI